MNADVTNNKPVAGVGAVVIHNDRVLLVKRAKPPFAGKWCIPGGKIHPGESLQAAAEREIWEETGVQIKAGKPIFAFDVIDTQHNPPSYHYVVVDLEAEYIGGEPVAQDDASDVAWFSKQEIEDDRVQALTQQFLREWWIG